MKIAIILGTRPEIIKMCPVIRECEKQKLDYFIIHTNQHYSENMDKIFFEELNLPKAKYNLGIGSGKQGEQTGRMLAEIEKVLMNEKPNIVIVQGDTNSVLAGALAATKLGIKAAHVEAGLRSYDRNMPEETNRVITDHISDYLFVPTKNQEKILLGEGIEKEKIFVVGNTVVDAVQENMEIANKKISILDDLGVKPNNYFLITMHRPSNVDNKENFASILKGFEMIYKKYKMPLVFPIHPRTKKMAEQFNLKFPEGIKLIEPVGYLEFLLLQKNAKLILTDSGGIQEEACILKVPSVTLRENTERPETVEVGASMLAGTDSSKILDYCGKMINKSRNWKNPFGDGTTGKQILNIILNKK